MLWSLSILVVALLLIAARFRSRDDGGVSRPLIWLAALLPPLALAATAFLGRGADRERIDVQFVGYRLPLSKVQPCGAPGRNLAAGKGVWIGGGRRWPDDRNPDLISLPGYRGHLAELCTDAKSGGLLVRQVRPGETWYQLPSQAWGLQKSNEIDTQRLVIRGAADGVERGCITYNGASIAVSSIVDFARRERKRAVRAAPMREMRVALRKRFGGWPEDADVACVDISGAAAKCAADIVSTKAPLFAWPTERKIAGGWDLVPPEGATWNACGGGNAIGVQTTRLELPQVAPRARLSAWKKSAANVTLRMLTRRTVGGVADQTVPVSADSSDPLPLRLGTAYELGFVQLGQDLVILHEDPSVQLRMTDLYGSPALEVKQGEFDLTFSSPSGEELLVVDLSSRADHLAPKTIFEDVQARVAVPQQGDELSVIAQGRPAEKRKFNEVFALDVSRNASTIRPLLLIRRVGAPAMTFLLPILAALLLIGATLLDRSADPLLPTRWLVAPLLLALLGLRFAMATRWLLNEYGSAEALRNWIVNGAFLLIAPPIVMLVAALLRRAKANVTVSRSTKDLYALPDSTKDAPPVRRVHLRQNAAQFLARLKERDVVPLLQWTCVAGASMAVWILFAGGERPDVFAAIRKLLPTLVVAALAASLAWGAFRGVAWLADLTRWKHLPLIARALIAGAALFAIRFLTYFIGSQEQLGIIRADVFALPLCAAILAAFTRPGERGRAAWARFLSFGVLFVILFGAVGGAMNDFGLLWVGGMAFVLALPAAMGDRVYAHIASYALFFVIFISPTVAPRPFRDAMRLFFGNRQVIGTVQFNDDLQVSRDRDYYRLIDASQPDAVTAIPSQLAREVVIERERVRYQSLDGAWREPFRSVKSPHSPWTGAGFLRGRAVVGDATFTRAARSDYVFPTYLRAEFGSLGLLAVLAMYVALFIFGALGTVDRMRAMPVALWSAAIAAGTGLFMLGGTTRIFPFSGKWPLLMSFASSSDAALALALLMLVMVEKD